MADFTDFAENKIVDLLMSGTAWAPTCYIGLFTGFLFDGCCNGVGWGRSW